MARDPKYDVLFEEVRLGPKVMSNRFMSAPHSDNVGASAPRVSAHYRATKADGGWGAVFLGAAQISPSFIWGAPDSQVCLWDEGDERAVRLMADLVHEHGALAGFETMFGLPIGDATLWHCGTRAPYLGASVRDLSRGDIKAIREMHVAAARRCVAAGIDLITLMEIFGAYIGHAFLLPSRNSRTDEYGGSLENRARFLREVLEDMREAVGDACAIGMRFNAGAMADLPELTPVEEEMLPPNYFEESLAAVEHLDDLVDYWDIYGTTAYGSSRFWKQNFNEQFVRDVRGYTKKPVITVGRFTDPDTMVRMVQGGLVDIISAARPGIADPFLPNKISEGRLDDIRECIGCNMCVSRLYTGGPIVCTQNATAMEEFRRGWHPERFSLASNRENDVLVIGAGPAGMECARVLGERSMRRVHLVDAQDEIGGHLRWVTQLQGLSEWRRVIDYRRGQLAKLANVEVILNTHLSVDDVLNYGAEIVVVATGSNWAADGALIGVDETIPGAGAPDAHVLTPEQIMVDGEVPGQRVTIYDVDGYFVGYSLALRLAGDGHAVTLVCSADVPAAYTKHTDEWPLVCSALSEAGVTTITGHYVTHIAGGDVELVHKVTMAPADVQGDSVVLVTSRVPDAGPYHELDRRKEERSEAGIVGVYRIGDCLVPDFIAEAVYSGHRLAREIDSPNPGTALPFVRDRSLITPTEDDYQLANLLSAR